MPRKTKKKGITWANNRGLPLHTVGNADGKQNYNRTPNVNKGPLLLRRLGLHNQIPNYQRSQTRKNWENEQGALRYEAAMSDAMKTAMNTYPKVSDENLNMWYKSFGNSGEPFTEWNGTPRNGAAAPVRNHSGKNEELGSPVNGGRRSRKSSLRKSRRRRA